MTDPESAAASPAFPPILIPVLALAVAFGLQSVAPLGYLPEPLAPGWQIIVGVALALAGAAIIWAASSALQRARAERKPDTPGLTLISTGPYRYSRNPIYIAFLLFQAGIAFAYSLEWGVVLLPVSWLAFDRMIIAREEAFLARRFGAEYQALLKGTKRWL